MTVRLSLSALILMTLLTAGCGEDGSPMAGGSKAPAPPEVKAPPPAPPKDSSAKPSGPTLSATARIAKDLPFGKIKALPLKKSSNPSGAGIENPAYEWNFVFRQKGSWTTDDGKITEIVGDGKAESIETYRLTLRPVNPMGRSAKISRPKATLEVDYYLTEMMVEPTVPGPYSTVAIPSFSLKPGDTIVAKNPNKNEVRHSTEKSTTAQPPPTKSWNEIAEFLPMPDGPLDLPATIPLLKIQGKLISIEFPKP